jgi:iron complex transport system ATP-binding protein
LTSILSLHHGSFAYGREVIFSDLDLEVKSGEVVCILGPNGCGKTTLMRCLSGSLKLKKGLARLDLQDISAMKEVDIARKIGFIFQEHEIPFPYPVIEVVLMGRTPHIRTFSSPSSRDKVIAEEALSRVGISHLKDRPYTLISGGERQLVLIARTLAQEPEIILMDEPTSHLDFKNQTVVLQMVNQLAEQGLAVVMTSHFPDHAFLFSQRVALMAGGRFTACGRPAEVMTEKSLGELYGLEVSVISVNDPATGLPLKLAVPRVKNTSLKAGDGTEMKGNLMA